MPIHRPHVVLLLSVHVSVVLDSHALPVSPPNTKNWFKTKVMYNLYSKLQFNWQPGVNPWILDDLEDAIIFLILCDYQWRRTRDSVFTIQVFTLATCWLRQKLRITMVTLAAGTWDVYPFGKETHLPNIHFWGEKTLLGENPSQGSVIIQPYNPRHFGLLPCC